MPNLQINVSKLTPLFVYLKKQQEIEKNRRIIEMALTFALISFFLFFAIRPTVLTISALIGDIKSKELLSSKMKRKIDQIITAQDNFAMVQEKYYLVEDALPSSPNFVDAFNQIDSNLQTNGINLDKISFAQSDKNLFSTQVSTNSSFSSSVNIISSLLNLRRLVNISQITYSQNKESQAKGEVNFALPIDVLFWQKQNEKK